MAVDNYLIPLTENERERLIKQYRFLNKMGMGGRAISGVAYVLPKDAKVLDSGTGTGAWLLDVADSTPPTVQLIGIDVSTALFPVSPPPNMQLMRCSAVALPADWSNTFDLVNQGLLLGALRTIDWPVVIAEQFRVLKPGIGRVQLLETSHWVTPTQSRTGCLIRELFSKKGMDPDCALRIPEYLLEAGFCDVIVHVRYIPLGKWAGEDGKMAMGIATAAKMAVLEGAFQQDVPLDMSKQECEEELRDIEDAWDMIPGTFIKLHVIEARKP